MGGGSRIQPQTMVFLTDLCGLITRAAGCAPVDKGGAPILWLYPIKRPSLYFRDSLEGIGAMA
jgi:hypothetical protein